MTHDPIDSQIPRPAPDERDAGELMVVGVGASAGGLGSLRQFVAAIPLDSGMAFVVISHPDPKSAGGMRTLLQDSTVLPVTQVEGPTTVEANHIYFRSSADDLIIRGSTLGLRATGARSERAPVDLFFRMLAEAAGADAVGVVLSGTGADGTVGIRHIREAGGITIAQSPDEAEHGSMPSSAIETGLVDLVLPSSRIPAELHRLRALPSRPENPTPSTPETDIGLAQVIATLRRRTGHDFSLYKRSLVLSRLDRRLRFNDTDTLDEYLPLLRSSSTECQALLRDLLISVSSFFRDPEAFEALSAQVPAFFEGKGPADTVRVWVVGCATGEEAYSIAMIISEHSATLDAPPRIQLFATDIDRNGYGWARAGLYDADAVSGIPPARLLRFFTKEPGGYRIDKSLRELILFAGHNVLHDSPFSRIDLISCRNLFSYLQAEAQRQLLETFHFALNPDGILLLGASESVGESARFAAATGSTQRLFHRLPAGGA